MQFLERPPDHPPRRKVEHMAWNVGCDRTTPIRTAEILCVGTELLLGDIVNTNAAFLSKQLAAMGISVYHQTVVGDHPDRLKTALSDARNCIRIPPRPPPLGGAPHQRQSGVGDAVFHGV